MSVGDVAILRTFGTGYIGRFQVGPWHGPEEWKGSDVRSIKIGFFCVESLKVWKRELPQPLILRDLSNRDVRSRLIRITAEDVLKVETAQRARDHLLITGVEPASEFLDDLRRST